MAEGDKQYGGSGPGFISLSLGRAWNALRKNTAALLTEELSVNGQD